MSRTSSTYPHSGPAHLRYPGRAPTPAPTFTTETNLVVRFAHRVLQEPFPAARPHHVLCPTVHQQSLAGSTGFRSCPPTLASMPPTKRQERCTRIVRRTPTPHHVHNRPLGRSLQLMAGSDNAPRVACSRSLRTGHAIDGFLAFADSQPTCRWLYGSFDANDSAAMKAARRARGCPPSDHSRQHGWTDRQLDADGVVYILADAPKVHASSRSANRSGHGAFARSTSTPTASWPTGWSPNDPIEHPDAART